MRKVFTDYSIFSSHIANRLQNFRWIVPPESEVKLRVRFYSEDIGHVDQTFNFEVMGTLRRYQLYCRGVCAFPTISKEPRYGKTCPHEFVLFFVNFISKSSFLIEIYL